MDTKTSTKFVIQRNDKFLKFNPTGEVEHDDPMSATLYSSPGKAQRRLNQAKFADAQLIAIDVSWQYSVPEGIDDGSADDDVNTASPATAKAYCESN